MDEKPVTAAHIEKGDDASSVSSNRKDEETAVPIDPNQDWTEEEEATLV